MVAAKRKNPKRIGRRDQINIIDGRARECGGACGDVGKLMKRIRRFRRRIRITQAVHPPFLPIAGAAPNDSDVAFRAAWKSALRLPGGFGHLDARRSCA